MKWIVFSFALISVGSGLVSAYYWLCASKVKITPAWQLEISGDHERNMMGWVTGNMIAFTKSGELNKYAACWTAATVISGAIANFIQVLAG